MLNAQISIKVSKTFGLDQVNTLFVGKVVHRFDQLPSTNDHAWHLLEQGRPPEGTVVRTDHQTAGKGQRGNVWEVPPGLNLTLSVILYPHFLAAARPFLLSQMAALAVRDTVLLHLPPHASVQVKWPNDVLLAGKKVAGILIQNILSSGKIQASVVGIGLNVNQRAFPAHLPHATSLAAFLGRTLSLDEVCHDLYRCLEQRYLQLRQGQEARIRRDYLSVLCGYQERRRFRTATGEVFEGVIAGVLENGQLIIDGPAGRRYFDLKEVAFAERQE